LETEAESDDDGYAEESDRQAEDEGPRAYEKGKEGDSEAPGNEADGESAGRKALSLVGKDEETGEGKDG
jgi:hypothetical protein